MRKRGKIQNHKSQKLRSILENVNKHKKRGKIQNVFLMILGNLATYSGAGSIQILRERRNVTKLILRELKEGLWIKRGTRYISLDLTLYNANLNYFCIIKFNFEFPPTGGIISTGDYKTVKLLRYITKSDYALMGAEFVFAFMVLYYFVEEVMEIKNNKLAYFTSFWNCLDVFVILVSMGTIVFNIYKYIAVNTLLKGLLAQPEIYVDFAYLAWWSKMFQNFSGLCIFVAWIKVFKFISFNKTMSQLAGTITKVIIEEVSILEHPKNPGKKIEKKIMKNFFY